MQPVGISAAPRSESEFGMFRRVKLQFDSEVKQNAAQVNFTKELTGTLEDRTGITAQLILNIVAPRHSALVRHCLPVRLLFCFLWHAAEMMFQKSNKGLIGRPLTSLFPQCLGEYYMVRNIIVWDGKSESFQVSSVH